MRWRLPSRPRCSLVVLVAAAGHDGRRPPKADIGKTQILSGLRGGFTTSIFLRVSQVQ